MFYKVLFRLLVTVVIAFVWAPRAKGAENPPNHLDEIHTPEEPTVIAVPGSSRKDLQSAIHEVPDRGIIELGTGVYQAPSTGYQIGNLNKSFSIRAAPGANVVLTWRKHNHNFRHCKYPCHHSGKHHI